jgi:hypothetical protein
MGAQKVTASPAFYQGEYIWYGSFGTFDRYAEAEFIKKEDNKAIHPPLQQGMDCFLDVLGRCF